MCLDASTFFDQKWLASITEDKAPVQVPEDEYSFPLHLDLERTRFDDFWTVDPFWKAQALSRAQPEPEPAPVQEQAPVQAPPPVPPEPEWSRARADVFVLTIETELYAAVMYDKRKLIDQHALSTI